MKFVFLKHKFLFGILMLLMILPGTCSAATNAHPQVSMLANWNFESWSGGTSNVAPDGFTLVSTNQFRSTDAKVGSYSYGINPDGSPGVNRGWSDQKLSPGPNGNYDLGAWVKVSNLTTGSVVVDIVNKSTWAVYGDITITKNGDWTYFTAPCNINDGDWDTLYLRICTVGANAGSTIKVDGVSLSTEGYTYIGDETDNGNSLTKTYTYAPGGVIPACTHILNFERFDLNKYNITSFSVTCDGVAETSYLVGNTAYWDASGLSTSAHSIVMTAAYVDKAPTVASAQARVAPYHGELTTVYNIAGGVAYAEPRGLNYLCAGQATKFMQTGWVNQVKFNAQNTNTVSDMRIRIWRYNDATGKYNMKYESDNLKPLIHDGLNTLDLSNSPIPVNEGDNYGIVLYGAGSTPVIALDTSSITSQANVRYGIYVDTTEFDWNAAGTTGGYNAVIAMEFDMNPPDMVWHGDSIMSYLYSFTDQNSGVTGDDYHGSAPYQFEQLTGLTYQNTGIAGDMYPNIRDRFNRDVVQKHPKYAVLEGGINNIGNGHQEATDIFPYLVDDIQACEANGITPVVMLLYPYGYNVMDAHDLAQYAAYNQMITDYCNSHGGIIMVDVRDAIGSQPDGVNWQMDVGYTLEPAGIRLHPNAAGNAVVAQTVYNAIYAYLKTHPPAPVSSNADFNKPITISIYTDVGVTGTVDWYIDGVKVTETSKKLTYVSSDPGMHNITAVTYFQDGSQAAPERFNVRVLRQLATKHIEPINTTHYENTQKAIKNKDLTAFVAESNGAYTDLIGRMYFLVVFGVAFGFIWLQQRRMTIPTVLFLITGGIFAGFIPGEYLFYGMVFCGLAIAVSLYRIAEGYNQ